MKYQTISRKQFFAVKGKTYYVAVATAIFHKGRYQVFARKLA